ncbi:MAG: EAL domain-containing protein [Eubacteriales bacterium]|nr:EAL domain-containing protein [Bacillota bacterium]MBV1728498.1 EAL domain-containing protein [Desulforudis sp.]MDP3051244.1 EAL domain-containing protein [Eubacteriales bacterium]MDQ7789293.1 EAL domain-containing protein [Clostridia bacterium]MBU4533088.1 EAL domain-containing protein [Bacillota bacterium]
MDGSFVRNLDKDPIHRALVQSMNTVAHTLGKKTVAESVENEAILKVLQDLNVDLSQGYHLGKPAPTPRSERICLFM